MFKASNAFVTKNRVQNVDNNSTGPLRTCEELGLAPVLLDEKDLSVLRQYMCKIVGRCLRYFVHFQQHYSQCIQWHIEHKHTAKCSEKSEIVSSDILGTYVISPKTYIFLNLYLLITYKSKLCYFLHIYNNITFP